MEKSALLVSSDGERQLSGIEFDTMKWCLVPNFMRSNYLPQAASRERQLLADFGPLVFPNASVRV